MPELHLLPNIRYLISKHMIQKNSCFSFEMLLYHFPMLYLAIDVSLVLFHQNKHVHKKPLSHFVRQNAPYMI